jgi:hypothetical protein
MSPLHEEIARLSVEFDQRMVHDQDIVKQLTLILGYSYLVESESQCRRLVHDHLLVLIDLLCARGHLDLCKRSLDILMMTADAPVSADAA